MAAEETTFHLQSLEFRAMARTYDAVTSRLQIRSGSRVDVSNTTDGTDDVSAIATPSEERSTDITVLWRARESRKRSGVVVTAARPSNSNPRSKYSERIRRFGIEWEKIGHGVLKMFTSFPHKSLAFWSALLFAIGSVLFIVSGILTISLPSLSTRLAAYRKYIQMYGINLTGVFGALLYLVGALVAYRETLRSTPSDASAVREVLESHASNEKVGLDEKLKDFIKYMMLLRKYERTNDDHRTQMETSRSKKVRRWRWIPFWCAQEEYNDWVGYNACRIQYWGAVLYAVMAAQLLVGIDDQGSILMYWLYQSIAAIYFIGASHLFVMEMQESFFKPEFKVVGWWVGSTAFVGSIGSEIAADAGMTIEARRDQSDPVDTAPFSSSVANTLGAALFLVSSVLQWYEAVTKHESEENLSTSQEK